jgi:heat shock protein HspQ
VKTLLALLPESLSSVVALITNKTYPSYEEVQFSLFCFLGGLADVDPCFPLLDTFAQVAGEYMMRNKKNRGHALMMAADFLGSDLATPEATRQLLHVLQHAPFESSRMWAVTGLEKCLSKLGCDMRQRIVSALEQASLTDPSEHVRFSAALLLDVQRGISWTEAIRRGLRS